MDILRSMELIIATRMANWNDSNKRLDTKGFQLLTRCRVCGKHERVNMKRAPTFQPPPKEEPPARDVMNSSQGRGE